MKRRTFIIGSLSVAWALATSKVRPATIADVKKHNSVQSPKIDAYCHFSTMGIIDFLEKESGRKPHVFKSLFANTPTLTDPFERLKLMDETGVDLSVLVPLPWLETAPAVHVDPEKCAAGDRRAVMPLIELLCNETQPLAVQASAINSLGKIGDPRAKRILSYLNSSQQNWLQQTATVALLKIDAKNDYKVASVK